ncbi:hypothetical protein GO684_03465 [Wolbachia endosymbiont of Litomosoides brasiliensis]|uniref:hypothetical protein n=1 Tax=Wolbachia endosymbiont of Litomosoides brasiliensis TaxID=1812117 RepID=UPI0015892D94|nr:hypothetical protein [Wolbachia endosymbiont of Litomosoides brasiliensis]NUY39707.1 hypothetical protein [Wolbachia endosymbiont of Litomosoides brasiliensis]
MRSGTHSKVGYRCLEKGIRTRVKVKLGGQDFYFDTVNPGNRESSSLFASDVDTDCMNIFLNKCLNI